MDSRAAGTSRGMIVSVAFLAVGGIASSSRGVAEEGTTARIDDSASSIEKEVRLRSMRLGLENIGRGFAAAWGRAPDDDARASHSSSGALPHAAAKPLSLIHI